MISTVIVTFNEAKKLSNCLSSIRDFSDEIVVIDLGSTDHTLDLARKYQAKIFHHKRVDYVEKVRNFAISKSNGEWILILDPDETLSDKLKIKLKEVAKLKDYSAVNIPRKNVFFGKWITHTNWWPDRHIRFFQKGKVTWFEKIHSYPKVEGRILNLEKDPSLAIIHLSYDNLSQFMERQNRYSTIEAEQRFKQGERFSPRNFIWRPIREFLVRFIKHAGFLDGSVGLSLTLLMMIYQLQMMIKLWEIERKNR